MKKEMYLNLQMKRAFKLYPSILLITILIVSCIALVFLGLINSSVRQEEKVIIRTGIVGDTEGAYLGIGVDAIKKMDSSRFYIDLVNMTETDAKEALKKGKISGYVYIPDGFINDVTSGEDVSLKYISLEDPGAINSLVEQEVVTTISSLVSETRRYIYGAVDLGKAYGSKNIYKKINKLNLSYVSFVLNRDNICELVMSENANSLSYGGYYLCALIVFFLSLWGISCNSLISDRAYELSALLKLRGIGFIRQLWARIFSFLTITYLTLVIFALIFGFTLQNIDFGIPEIIGTDVVTAVIFTIKILPVVFMFAVMHIAFCEVFTGIGGLIVQFIVLLVFGYLSGLFYPTGFFPVVIRNIMAHLPVGTGFSYIKNALLGTDVFKDLCLCCLYGILFFAMGVYIRKHKAGGGAGI